MKVLSTLNASVALASMMTLGALTSPTRLHAQQDADTGPLEVVASAVRVGPLMDEEEEKVYVGVALAAATDARLTAAGPALQKATAAALRKHSKVAKVVEHNAPGMLSMSDDALARQVAQLLDVDRVVVIRMEAGAAGMGPDVTLVLFSDEGLELARSLEVGVLRGRASASGPPVPTAPLSPPPPVPAPPPPAVLPQDGAPPPAAVTPDALPPPDPRAPPPPAPLQDDGGDPGMSEELDEDEDELEAESDLSSADRKAARKEFLTRALLLKKVRDEEGNKVLTVFRGGKAVSSEELDELGAPDPFVPTDSNAGLRKLLGVALLPTPLATFLLCGAGGWLFCVTFCTGVYFLDSVANGADVIGNTLGGFLCGSVCGLFPGLVAGVVGLLGGLVGTGAGAGVLAYELTRTDPPHPYAKFVYSHNKRLARELRLRSADLPRRYFPKRR